MANKKRNKVRLATHEGKLVVDVNWPDYQRNRVRVPDAIKGNELRLRIASHRRGILVGIAPVTAGEEESGIAVGAFLGRGRRVL